MRKIPIITVFIAGCLAAGCSATKIEDPKPAVPINRSVPEAGIISGIIVNNKGGAAVENAIITAVCSNTNFTVLSGSDGSYTVDCRGFTGPLELRVNKNGLAESKIQQIDITRGQLIDIPVYPVLSSVYNLGAPTISVTSITDNMSLTSITNLYIGIVSSGTNPVESTYDHSSILVYYGSDVNSQPVYSSDSGSLTITNLNGLPPGDSRLVIVTYDINNNRSALFLRIHYDNGSSNLTPGQLNISSLKAVTLGQALPLFNLASTGRSVLRTGAVTALDPLSVPPNTTIYTIMYWPSMSSATGYNIYRSDGAPGAYRLIGSAAANGFQDTSPDLIIGQKYYYYVRAYNAWSEGEKSGVKYVQILDRYNITLLSPTNGLANSGLTPTLSWKADIVAGADSRVDKYYLREADSDTFVFDESITIPNPTNSVVTFQVPAGYLNHNEDYEWDVWDSYYVKYNDADSSAVSYSYPKSFAGYGYGSCNGAFSFSTGN